MLVSIKYTNVFFFIWISLKTTERMSCALINVFEGLMVHVVFNKVQPSVETFRSDFLSALQQLLDNKAPFTLFVDTSEMGTVPLSVCLDIVRFMKKNRDACKLYLRASAIIVKNEFITGLLQYVFTLSPPVSPNRVTKNPTDALDFIHSHMAVASVGTPLSVDVN